MYCWFNYFVTLRLFVSFPWSEGPHFLFTGHMLSLWAPEMTESDVAADHCVPSHSCSTHITLQPILLKGLTMLLILHICGHPSPFPKAPPVRDEVAETADSAWAVHTNVQLGLGSAFDLQAPPAPCCPAWFFLIFRYWVTISMNSYPLAPNQRQLMLPLM